MAGGAGLGRGAPGADAQAGQADGQAPVPPGYFANPQAAQQRFMAMANQAPVYAQRPGASYGQPMPPAYGARANDKFSPNNQAAQNPMITRVGYNPGNYINAGNNGYGAWRPPQNFKPYTDYQNYLNRQAEASAAANPQSEVDKLRAEIEAMRAAQTRSDEGR